MTIATKHIETTAVAPSSRGTFSGEILYNPEFGDTDGERIENWTNLPAKVDLGYQHVTSDPLAVIGIANCLSKGDDRRMLVFAKLALHNPQAQAVHQRLLLPTSDAGSLSQLSVGFAYPTERTYKDAGGVTVIRDAQLLEVSVVHRGAQTTRITEVKSRTEKIDPEVARLNTQLDALLVRPATKTAPDLVDRFIAEDRALRRREREEMARWAAAIARTSVSPGALLPSEAARDERDRERFEREQAERDRRDAEKEREAAERDRVDVARRGGDIQVIAG